MRLLWFSHFVPFPPRGGNRQRSFNLIRQMSNSHEISLVALNQQGDSPENLQEWRSELANYCTDVQTWNLPWEWRSTRWWTELPLSVLRTTPFACRSFWSPRLAARWEQVLQQQEGSLLHFDSPDLALFVPAAKRFRKVLNHHNCESAMASRRADKESNPVKKAFLRAEARKLARVEGEICDQFDVNTVVSENDSRLLALNSPQAHIHVVENGVDIGYFRPTETEEEPSTLVFAGSLDWYPNISGLLFFKRTIWPILKQQRPDIRLCLAGRNPARSLLGWADGDEKVSVVANPVDVRPLVARAAVFICPILDGGGSRLKILDAMAMGKAVVSTAIGCEGLRVKHQENILIDDKPEDFAGEVLRLLRDKPSRNKIKSSARALVEQHYSWEQVGRQLDRAYACAAQHGLYCQDLA